MKILFHTNTLSFRGTTVAVADYARYAQEILGHESIICYNTGISYGKDSGTEPAVLEMLEKSFKIVSYNGGTNIQTVVDQEKPDVAYFIRAGDWEFVPDNCQTLVHAVFQTHAPHGDVYAYISEWLADHMNRQHHTNFPWVPHMINLPQPTGDLREYLGIPADKTVVGRIGGYTTFDLGFVKESISRLVEQRNDFVFVMVGTEPWTVHPNIIFLPEIADLQAKSNFVNTCDAMVHARYQGETFGLAIGEALSLNKPVLSWESGIDLNHTVLLKDSGLLYNTENFFEKLSNIRDYIGAEDWSKRISNFTPRPVMEKFNEIFLGR